MGCRGTRRTGWAGAWMSLLALALGERRAHAAMAYLTGLGVSASRLSMTSYGKEKPVCVESVESCWFRNRRAHFSLLK